VLPDGAETSSLELHTGPASDETRGGRARHKDPRPPPAQGDAAAQDNRPEIGAQSAQSRNGFPGSVDSEGGG
jgi:hypothetical protein